MNDASERSRSAWRQLEHEWGQTQERWRDSASDYFEEHYWTPLEDEARNYARALEALMEVLEAARDAVR